MNTYTKFFLALCCSGTIVSCSNDLDEKVYSKITEQTYNYTVDDFSPSIASVYSQLRSFPSHGGYFTTQEVSADAIVMPPNASGWDDGGVYRRMHYQTWNSEQGHVSEIWSNFYQGALLSTVRIADLVFLSSVICLMIGAEQPCQHSRCVRPAEKNI